MRVVNKFLKNYKLILICSLGLLIAFEPRVFSAPFDFIFDLHGTHLSLGTWLSILVCVLFIIFNAILAITYLLSFNKNRIKFFISFGTLILMTYFFGLGLGHSW